MDLEFFFNLQAILFWAGKLYCSLTYRQSLINMLNHFLIACVNIMSRKVFSCFYYFKHLDAYYIGIKFL